MMEDRQRKEVRSGKWLFQEICVLLQESIRSRVAMDFTGSVGRIVEDPAEAQAIAESERSKIFHRKLRPNPNVIPDGMDTSIGIHTLQPWFHSKLTRDQATMLINKHGCVDG